jgi:hypothetical protein
MRMNIKELEEAAKAERAEVERHVSIADGHIVFADEQGYTIAVDRVATEDAILRWTYHLANKPWMTLPISQAFYPPVLRASPLELLLR